MLKANEALSERALSMKGEKMANFNLKRVLVSSITGALALVIFKLVFGI